MMVRSLMTSGRDDFLLVVVLCVWLSPETHLDGLNTGYETFGTEGGEPMKQNNVRPLEKTDSLHDGRWGKAWREPCRFIYPQAG